MLRRLRGAFAELITVLPGRISTAADLHQALHTNMKLSWKMLKVANASHPLAAGPHVPGPANIQTMLKAARKCAIADSIVQNAARAAADFERLVAEHAGERDVFDSMISILASREDAERLDFMHRRDAFRAQRLLWGAHARTVFRCAILELPDGGHSADIAAIWGYVDLRRTRPGPLTLGVQWIDHDDEQTPIERVREPLDPAGSAGQGTSLMPEFCSQPLPQTRMSQIVPGARRIELLGNGMGNRDAATIFEGHVVRQLVPCFRTANDDNLDLCLNVSMPAEVAIQDAVISEAVYPNPSLTGVCYGYHVARVGSAGALTDLLDLGIQATVAYLGTGPGVLHTPDIPRYAEMVEGVLAQLGWDPARFHVYRCRLSYPVVPSEIQTRIKLPEPPEE